MVGCKAKDRTDHVNAISVGVAGVRAGKARQARHPVPEAECQQVGYLFNGEVEQTARNTATFGHRRCHPAISVVECEQRQEGSL